MKKLLVYGNLKIDYQEERFFVFSGLSSNSFNRVAISARLHKVFFIANGSEKGDL